MMNATAAMQDGQGAAGKPRLLESDDERESALAVLRAYAGELETKAEEQVSKRQTTEERWLDDVRQFHGRYDATTERNLRDEKKSRLFANITRPKTNAWEARLSDMLFPTDEKNWGIRPTPNPELAESAKITPGATEEQTAAAATAEAIQEKAKAAAEAMQREIDDQLTESGYNAACRDVIHDACLLGTGVVKGPILAGRTKRQWRMTREPGPDGAMMEAWGLVESGDQRPAFERVDPWCWFPDMSARTLAQCEFFFERHLWSKSDVKDLALIPGFFVDEIEALLKDEPSRQLPYYLSTLREITAGDQTSLEGKYIGWEYRGPIPRKVMLDMCRCFDDRDLYDVINDEEEGLEKIEGVVWFCQGHIVSFGIHVLDSGDPLYSVFNLEKDETSPLGYGVPYLLRNPQAAANAGWRMMMDNGGLSTGPQVVVNQDVIEPADGFWDLTPRKVWKRIKAQTQGEGPAFEVHSIPSGQTELANIVEMARSMADEEAALPLIAQGDPGARASGPQAGAQKTMGGLSILMNATNVVFRRTVKNYDDQITVPNIQRIYDWNMQFSKKDEIKGDYQVDARGSSVLLVRELQAQNLMVVAMQFGSHPLYGAMIKHAAVLRRVVQANMIPADEIVKSDDEIQADMEKAANQPTPDRMKAEIETATLNAKQRIAQMELEAKIELARIERETRMMEMASKMNMSLDQINAGIEKMRSDERLTAAEFALKQRMGSGI